MDDTRTLTASHSLVSSEQLSFFEVNRTPPDEKKRKEKAAQLAAEQTPEFLMLTPFTSTPKVEKGFSIDYVAFELGGKEETTLLIGWTPTKGGNVRENFIVRFGKFSAQVILIGSCIAPEVKSVKGRP